nr:hypothetical protein [Tanacetum cinerariifolium]
MNRDVLTVGSTMMISLLYRGEYSQWVERFMNYLEEQTDGEAMINSIKNGDQPLPHLTQVSIAETTSIEQPPLKDKSIWSDQEKRVQKIDRLARSLLIQGLPNDIYSLIGSNKTAKDLWDALARHMLGFECGEQDRKAAVLYDYETFKANEGELLLDTYIRYLQVINDLKKCGYSKDNYVNDAMVSKKKTIVVTSDPLHLIAEKTKVSKSKEKVVVSLDFEGSDVDDFSELKKIIALLKQEFVKTDNKRVEKKDDEKKRDMSRVKCYNCKKEGHFVKDCKKVKVKDYEYYKTKMLLAKKDKDEQVLLAEDQAWMESSNLKTFSSVRRPKNSGVIWKKKGSSNTSNVGLSIVKEYQEKDKIKTKPNQIKKKQEALLPPLPLPPTNPPPPSPAQTNTPMAINRTDGRQKDDM